jgi:hypothetical protein
MKVDCGQSVERNESPAFGPSSGVPAATRALKQVQLPVDTQLSPSSVLLPLQGEDPFPKSILTYVAHTSALTYPPSTRAKYPESLPLRTLSRLQPDELSPKADSSVDRQHLIAALSAYAAQRPLVSPGEGDPGLRYLIRNPSRTLRPLSAPTASQRRPSPPGDPKDPPSMGDGECLSRRLFPSWWGGTRHWVSGRAGGNLPCVAGSLAVDEGEASTSGWRPTHSALPSCPCFPQSHSSTMLSMRMQNGAWNTARDRDGPESHLFLVLWKIK